MGVKQGTQFGRHQSGLCLVRCRYFCEQISYFLVDGLNMHIAL